MPASAAAITSSITSALNSIAIAILPRR